MVQHAVNIDDYCRRLKIVLLSEFGENLLYMGLQGSYLREEETAMSDIDVMVILETLTMSEMDGYRRALETVGDADRSCDFICSRADMANWNPLEICQIKHTTKDLHGMLDDFLPPWTIEDETNYIKVSLNNLYHALCHGYIHGNKTRMRERLISYYKSAFFILQNTHFLETYCVDERHAEFILTKSTLRERLRGEDRDVMDTLFFLAADGKAELDIHFDLLLRWCQRKMIAVGART